MTSAWRVFLKGKNASNAQFIKYVVCGGISVAVDQAMFYFMAIFFLPCLRPDDPAVVFLERLRGTIHVAAETELKRNYWIIKSICFVASNVAVYALNVLFVFETGRHRKLIEILLFFSVSFLQFFFIWLGSMLITEYGWEVTYANAAVLLTSIGVNFILRKKVVFKG